MVCGTTPLGTPVWADHDLPHLLDLIQARARARGCEGAHSEGAVGARARGRMPCARFRDVACRCEKGSACATKEVHAKMKAKV